MTANSVLLEFLSDLVAVIASHQIAKITCLTSNAIDFGFFFFVCHSILFIGEFLLFFLLDGCFLCIKCGRGIIYGQVFFGDNFQFKLFIKIIMENETSASNVGEFDGVNGNL